MTAGRSTGAGAAFVAIVNYRTGAMVVECLRSLDAERGALRGGRVIVVDNASGDDSLAVIGAAIEAHGWQAWAELVALPRNGGFAYGTNRAIDRVRAHDPAFAAVIGLNPDTVVRPGALAALLAHLDAQPDAGIVGATIEDEHGMPQSTAHTFPRPLRELDAAAQFGLLSRLIGAPAAPPAGGNVPRRCDWVSGACFAIRRELLDRIGGLDEAFFLYFEETDFCWRAQRAGWSCWYVPAARVMHWEGSSTGIRTPRKRRPAYWFASRRRFFVKVYGVRGLVAADLLWAVGRFSIVVRRALRLGGRGGVSYEPERLGADLLGGDFKALLGGELRRIGAAREPAHGSV